jgi:NAD(P)H dehydrogenase (quinone)
MVSVTVGTSPETYAYNGRSGDIDLMLWPVNFSLAYVGYEVLEPFVAYGVEAGLRYSAADVVEARLKRIEADYAAALTQLDQRPVVPFNKMADWGADGRIKPDAPAYSPYMRHRQNLLLK